MKLAIFSDIHGNPLALDAVLHTVEGEVDGYIGVGDYVAIGYDPATVIQRLQALPNAHFVRGNTDRYTLTNDRPYPSFADVVANPELLSRYLDVHAQFVWTRGYLTPQNLLGWLESLPLEYRLTLPDGTRVLAVHARPGTDDGDGLDTDLSDDELYAIVKDVEADLILVGHHHVPMDRTVNGIRVVNVASVSNPVSEDLRASYALLNADEKGYTLELKRVAYDYQAVLEAIDQSRHPARDYLRHFWET